MVIFYCYYFHFDDEDDDDDCSVSRREERTSNREKCQSVAGKSCTNSTIQCNTICTIFDKRKKESAVLNTISKIETPTQCNTIQFSVEEKRCIVYNIKNCNTLLWIRLIQQRHWITHSMQYNTSFNQRKLSTISIVVVGWQNKKVYLYCNVLYCIVFVFNCIVLYCIVLYFIVL